MVSKDESAAAATAPTARDDDVLAPMGESAEVATAAASIETPAGSKKKFMGLGSYLPKVPAYLKGGPAPSAAGPVESAVGAEDPADELKELPELVDRRSNDSEQRPPPPPQQSAAAAAAAALRRRGMSIEQNVSTLYRRMTIRQSSNSTGSSTSTGSSSPPGDRSSLTDASALSPRGAAASDGSASSFKPQRGACVATKFGTGVVLDVREADGFYVVQLVPKSVAFLREDALVREIKAVVGERVKTRWGLATVEQYYVDDDMYSIALDWRWDDEHVWRMKATTKKFEKLAPRGGSLVQNTKNKLFEGYSAVRGSTSSGYATVVARLNTPAATVYSAGATVRASATSGLSTLSTLAATKLAKPKFHKGERVVTKMGSGFIVDARPLEKIYEVYLRRLKFTGYFHEAALTAFPYERVTHFVVDGRTIPAPEIPRNVSEVKRRQVINAAIQSAREGKLLQAPGGAAAPAAAASVPAPVAAPGVL